MRILKYLFLLLLLALFAVTVYVATQKGDFEVIRTAVVKSPKATVFNYVNDYRNWETFDMWEKENKEVQFFYSRNTVGKGGFYSWQDGSQSGDSKTLAVMENESIKQRMTYNGSVAKVYWTFKDTVGGTKVTWRSKGKMSFGFKVFSVFQGGADGVLGNLYERNLANLDKTLDYELKTYSIKVDGVVQKPGCFYLKQTITSKISNVPKNLRIMIPRLTNFFKKNKISMHGKPFVLYHTFDLAKGITRLSVCIPVGEEIFISEGSDVAFGKLYPYGAVKSTLKGDASHKKEAWDKTFAYIDANHLTEDAEGSYLEIYAKSIDDIAYPSQWLTEIYIPVTPKAVVVEKPKPATAKALVVPVPQIPVEETIAP